MVNGVRELRFMYVTVHKLQLSPKHLLWSASLKIIEVQTDILDGTPLILISRCTTCCIALKLQYRHDDLLLSSSELI
jgi:hypothetical protein